MKKSDLLNFINRYYLAGATTSVKWTAENGSVETKFISDDQNVIGSVVTSLDLGNTELGVYATPTLTKMLTALGDDITVKINTIDSKSVSIDINDTDVDMKFMLADLSVIRQVPDLKQIPDWNVTINIDKDFIAKFIKSKNALPDSENFALSCKNGQVDITMNYSSINTNRIKFSMPCNSDSCTDMGTTCFSSNLFKEILQSNKDAVTGTLEVSSAGLSRVVFTGPSFTSIYYLVQLQTS